MFVNEREIIKERKLLLSEFQEAENQYFLLEKIIFNLLFSFCLIT